jgi:hypothetical protein
MNLTISFNDNFYENPEKVPDPVRYSYYLIYLSFVPAVPVAMLLCSAAGAEESRIRHFSCNHVVPGSNLLPLVMAAGPSGIQLDFSYQHRGTTSTLGKVLPPFLPSLLQS